MSLTPNGRRTAAAFAGLVGRATDKSTAAPGFRVDGTPYGGVKDQRSVLGKREGHYATMPEMMS